MASKQRMTDAEHLVYLGHTERLREVAEFYPDPIDTLRREGWTIWVPSGPTEQTEPFTGGH